MSVVFGNPVTVHLSNQSYSRYKPLIEIGDIIKVKRKKRLRLIVMGYQQNTGCATIQTRKAYSPAPKSRLKSKTVFSKIKIKLINV